MGCGASKGSSGGADEKIKFDKVGVASLDNFFDQASSVKDSLEDLIGPLEENREKLMELTGFEWIPGTSKKIIYITIYRIQPYCARNVPFLCS